MGVTLRFSKGERKGPPKCFENLSMTHFLISENL
jgi:hypothetical protein